MKQILAISLLLPSILSNKAVEHACSGSAVSKVNRSYWSDITVKEAMPEQQSERVQQRLAEDTEHTGVVHG